MSALDGGCDHDAPGARQAGLAHIDRLAIRASVDGGWISPPLAPRRRRVARTLLTMLAGCAVLLGAWVATP